MKLRSLSGLFSLFILLIPVLAAANNFLVISDIHLNNSGAAMDINPSRSNPANDIDSDTLDRLVLQINQNMQKLVVRPDFILLLGDLPGHLRAADSARAEEATVFSLLKNAFAGIPIFYVAGNNDSLLSDYGPFTDLNRSAAPKNAYDIAKQSGWVGGFLSSTEKLCGTTASIFPCVITQNTTDGYYSAYLKQGFRMIAMNSVMFSKSRNAISEQSAQNELTWFETQLQEAQANKESVLIVTHIPPGKNVYDNQPFWVDSDQPRFLAAVQQYHSIISGILASHTHTEELKKIVNTGVGVFFAPALSTSHGNAPAIKTFYFDLNNGKWQLSNTTTFSFIGSNANPVLKYLYDYNKFYCRGTVVSMSECFDNVTAEKMLEYYTAGNPSFHDSIPYGADIDITL